MKIDYRAKPVHKLVVMGESNAFGMCAGVARNEWVQVLADEIRADQDEPLMVFNNAIPANVISPDAPGYEKGQVYATAPSAIERLDEDMLAYTPDLAVFAYGLNDSRCGHNLQSFIHAYEIIVSRTRAALPEALVVLVGPYWNIQYDRELWESCYLETPQPQYGKFSCVGDELVLAYNREIARLAARTGALFVDVYNLLVGATWLINADGCHFTDAGQRVIGMAVYCQLAVNCSFLGQKSKRMETVLNLTINNTGGTEALPHVIQSWRKTGLRR
jgi:lysophospholipase L1-like esterase